MKKTTFTRKSKPAGNQIPGVTLSSNGLLVLSTGVPTFDEIVGGLTLGSVCLIEEDVRKTYSTMFLKCLISEGVVSGHEIVVATHDDQLTQNLPALVDAAGKSQTHDDEDLKIAWRYARSQPRYRQCSSNFNHKFEFSKPVTDEFCEKASTLITRVDDLDYKHVLASVKEKVDGAFVASSARPSNVLRIVIDGIGSPFWVSRGISADKVLNQFLFMLKSIVRPSYAIAFVTVPSFVSEMVCLERLQRISDISVGLKAFGTSEKRNSDFKDYHGLISIEQLSQFNSLGVGNKESFCDLAFKFHKKQFVVEKLHLPPLFGENAVGQGSCSQKPGKGRIDDF